ncbi:PQQ-binding-like beta-propeller repeat protein [Gammaproteobacteria bacterium]|nr:PQQ-binding-like beta-propeller repeat protein [Gammaproteobacteria bacterium]
MEAKINTSKIFPIILFVIAFPLVLGGLQLLFLGGSIYYLVAGLALAYSGWCFWHEDPQGSLVYASLLFLTIAWSFMEAGTNLWALAPRILPFAVLGSWLLTPWQRNVLYDGNPPPLFASSIAKAAVPLSLVIIVFVFVDDTGYEVSEMSARSGINTINSATDWPSYGNSEKGTRYSPLDQINTDNVEGLELAWTYRTGAGGAFKATPLMVGELLFMCTGGNRILALNAESGALAWQFDPLIDSEHLSQSRYFTTGCRGVSYYEAPPEYNGECQERILTNTTDARLIAVDALTGERCSSFGDQGEVNLTIGMGNDPRIANFQTSPPGIVSGNAVVGGWVLDNRSVGPPSGVVRAFNAINGELAWAWDMGRPGITTEPLRGEVYTRGTPNVWSLFSVDEELGLIFAPTGNETPDYFGGLRMEVSDQYASSVVAIDGTSGNIRWSYQTVHHDIWDYDVPSQPTLIDLPGENGEKVKALVQPTKRGEVFVLNRETGEPLFDIQELPVPQTGGVPEDYVAATQPFTMDLPIWRMELDESKMWGITPLDQLWCRIEYRKMRYEGHFTVPGVGTILQNPGATGGFNWGSISVDEANNLMIVNPLYMANQLTLIPRDQLPEGVLGSQLGTPYSHRTQRFMSPLHVPCMQPPYGTIGVVDLETKELLWQKPIGTAKETGPLNIPTRLPLTVGTPQTGGTVTTAGGLIFSAGAFDNTVRATGLFDGRELWREPIPFTAQGTPMTYLSPEGKQTLIVVVPVFNSTRGSGYEPLPAEDEDPLGGYVFAYRLPD